MSRKDDIKLRLEVARKQFGENKLLHDDFAFLFGEIEALEAERDQLAAQVAVLHTVAQALFDRLDGPGHDMETEGLLGSAENALENTPAIARRFLVGHRLAEAAAGWLSDGQVAGSKELREALEEWRKATQSDE